MVKQKLKGCYSNKKGGSNQNSNIDTEDKSKQLKETFYNSATLFSFISPYILISFFLLLSLFNSNSKGIMYVIGAMILAIIVKSFASLVPPISNIKACNFFGDIINDIPCYSTALYSYTFMYLFMAMYNSNIMNYGVVIIFLILGAADAAVRLNYNCTNGYGILYGLLVGGGIGTAWYFLFSSSSPQFLYFDEYVSNKVACSVPKKQDFKCQLYKDGQLVDSIDTDTGTSGGDGHIHSIDVN